MAAPLTPAAQQRLDDISNRLGCSADEALERSLALMATVLPWLDEDPSNGRLVVRKSVAEVDVDTSALWR